MRGDVCTAAAAAQRRVEGRVRAGKCEWEMTSRRVSAAARGKADAPSMLSGMSASTVCGIAGAGERRRARRGTILFFFCLFCSENVLYPRLLTPSRTQTVLKAFLETYLNTHARRAGNGREFCRRLNRDFVALRPPPRTNIGCAAWDMRQTRVLHSFLHSPDIPTPPLNSRRSQNRPDPLLYAYRRPGRKFRTQVRHGTFTMSPSFTRCGDRVR